MMNDLKLNESYSSLKMSWMILNKELTTMKEKNVDLNHKVKELESTISSILQRKITKEEMKEMIKEGLKDINNTLKEIDVVNTQTQRDNIDKVITSINLCKQTKKQHPRCVTYILELLDGRIAVSCCGGAISLNQMNYQTKE